MSAIPVQSAFLRLVCGKERVLERLLPRLVDGLDMGLIFAFHTPERFEMKQIVAGGSDLADVCCNSHLLFFFLWDLGESHRVIMRTDLKALKSNIVDMDWVGGATVKDLTQLVVRVRGLVHGAPEQALHLALLQWFLIVLLHDDILNHQLVRGRFLVLVFPHFFKLVQKSKLWLFAPIVEAASRHCD
jgi:hypothetical protein